jgi:hypothetical protein
MEVDVKGLKEEIKKAEWIDWSCGRSTDYVDEFWEEGSIENLLEMIDKYSKIEEEMKK